MSVIPDGYAQATMVYTSAVLPYGAVNTLGIDVQGFAGTPQDAAAALYLAWTPVVQGLAGLVRLSEVAVKFGPTATGPSASQAGETISPGGATAPPNVCILVSKVTGLGGRKGKGRLFLPGVSENAVSDAGVILPATVTDLSGRLGDAFADMLTAGLPPVLLHSDATVPTPILNFNPEPIAATQRTRMRK